ncbi:MAG: hypothetical protein QM765_50185 [Myxococcales bacterium]
MSALKTALATLWAPGRALKEAADGRLFFWPLLLATVIGVGYTALFLPRADLVAIAEKKLDELPAEDAAKMTPHEREEKIEQAGKLSVISSYAAAALGPAFSALVTALMLWLGFKVAGGKPTFMGSFAVAAHTKIAGLFPSSSRSPRSCSARRWSWKRSSSFFPRTSRRSRPRARRCRT